MILIKWAEMMDMAKVGLLHIILITIIMKTLG